VSSGALLSDLISTETLARLHPEAITDHRQIADLIRGWAQANAPLRRGTNRAVAPELATIVEIDPERAVLDCINFGEIGPVVFLSTEYRGVPYFCSFSVRKVGKQIGRKRKVVVLVPGVIYRAERRDRARRGTSDKVPSISILRETGQRCEARVVDVSGDGMGVAVPPNEHVRLGEGFRIEGGDRSSSWAIARNQRAHKAVTGWHRIGFSVLPAAPGTSLASVTASTVLSELGGLAESSNPELLPEEPTIVRFQNTQGEELVGILDQVGDPNRAPAILIPSAWGKTKETLAGLAATILATFAEANRSVSVLRFDGIRKRGESRNDPECRPPHLQNLNYTFTQGATDLLAAARFLQEECAARQLLIVSLSVASIEARRAIVIDRGNRFSGWISVVGATDPQSLIRVISGGVDYLAGAERGVQFGRQYVQGMLLDIDRTATEALSSRIAFLDDARRDFAAIRCPITWISGDNDAWTDPLRVQDALAFGPNKERRLITSDTGHQLKSSLEAAEVFGIVASECARLLGVHGLLQPVSANSRSLRARRSAERRRLRAPDVQVDLRSFWRDYLLGRDLNLGMELVTETSAYRALMHEQIVELQISEGQTIVDLGSGVATFERALGTSGLDLSRLRVIAVDLILEGMQRGRAALRGPSPLPVGHIVADLGLGSARSLPLSPGSANRVLGSLLLNYLSNPERFLSEVYFLLRPGGRLVLSVLRKDADTSKICVSGIAELRTGQGLASFGQSRETEINDALGGFISDAARLLDLEEQGLFRFWDRDDLRAALEKAGFVDVAVRGAFGDPPQAWLVSAVRSEQVSKLA
jgi:ubiquinone/menaquinone biosynthesis C-methylase UbiE/pimeloyl-ACP methyl ester carboxylesterase